MRKIMQVIKITDKTILEGGCFLANTGDTIPGVKEAILPPPENSSGTEQ